MGHLSDDKVIDIEEVKDMLDHIMNESRTWNSTEIKKTLEWVVKSGLNYDIDWEFDNFKIPKIITKYIMKCTHVGA